MTCTLPLKFMCRDLGVRVFAPRSAMLLHDSGLVAALVAEVSAETAAVRLGRHSVDFTLDRDVHALESLDDDAADGVQAMVEVARQRAG